MLRNSPVILASLLLALGSAARASEGAHENALPVWTVADAAAPTVSAANLLSSERFWPYQAALARGITLPGGSRELPAGTLGVVIRIEPGARVRIDFGRDGLATLPVGATDVVARANAIRTGAAQKTAPNLTYAIAPRLLDAGTETPRRVRLEDSFERSAFLCVFARPDAPSFPKLASLVVPLANERVLLVLFAQGEHPDAELHARVRAAGWQGAFALNHLAEAYTRTLVDGEIDEPQAALYSAEGRELWSGEVRGELPPELARAVARATRPPSARPAAAQ
jgi:hypothetical protein